MEKTAFHPPNREKLSTALRLGTIGPSEYHTYIATVLGTASITAFGCCLVCPIDS